MELCLGFAKIDCILEHENGLEVLDEIQEDDESVQRVDFNCLFCEKEIGTELRNVHHNWKVHQAKTMAILIHKPPT